MRKTAPPKGAPVDDSEFRHMLKRYDPLTPASGFSLTVLEVNILAQIGRLAADPVSAKSRWFFRIFQQDWRAQTAAFASVLIIASGFVVGQIFYDAENLSSLTNNLSLVAFADEAAKLSAPEMGTSWGDVDDDAE